MASQLTNSKNVPSQLVCNQAFYSERKIYYDKNQLYECRNLQP